MIEINLVPPQIRKKRRAGKTFGQELVLPRETFIGVVGGFILLLLAAMVLLQVFIFIKKGQLGRYKKEMGSIEAAKTNVDRVLQELKGLQERGKAIREVTKGKSLVLSQKLNQISDNLPRGVWLQRVTLDQNSLIIQGSAVSQDRTEMIQVHTLTSNLKGSPDFMKHLGNVELELIKTRLINTTQVADFTIVADLP